MLCPYVFPNPQCRRKSHCKYSYGYDTLTAVIFKSLHKEGYVKRLILSILAVFAIVGAVVGCTSGSTSSGNTELQGTWKATSPDGTVTITFTFSGNHWTMTEASAAQSQSIQLLGTFTIDSTANPKTIDLHIAAHPSSELIGKTILNIYQLSGTNLLVIAFGDNPDTARPTAFTGTNVYTFIKQ